MDLKIPEIARRIRSLREDFDFTIEEMAEAIGITPSEYELAESGTQDFSFTFLYRCAEKLDVDMIDLLTGEGPHLTGYSLVRAKSGLPIKRRAGFEYLHLAPTFKDKLCEPFMVTAPFKPEEQDSPISLATHVGQELDYILTGHLRFAYDGHVEELGPGDTLLYDSSKPHGMIAIGGEPCTFLAVVLKDPEHLESHDYGNHEG